MTAHLCPMCGGREHDDWRPASPSSTDRMTAACNRVDHERCRGYLHAGEWSGVTERRACACICHDDNRRKD